MDAKTIITIASEHGVHLYVESNKLKFKAQSGALTDELKKLIGNNKDSIISFLTNTLTTIETGDDIESVQIDKAGAFEEALSFSQRRLWLADRMRGGSPEYNMHYALEVKGELDLDAVQKAINVIIERHEIIRTVYQESGDELKQVVRDNVDFRLDVLQLKSADESHRDQYITEAIESFNSQVFDLSRDLMLKAGYMRLGEGAGIILFNMHHIASDAWSMGVFVKEFLSLYSAIHEQQEVQLSPLSIQYSDYARWQNDWLEGAKLKEQENYWLKQLEGAPATHSIALDSPRSGSADKVAEVVRGSVPAELTNSLEALAQSNNLTMYMLVHAALSIVLAKYSGDDDVVVSTAVANRRNQVLSPMIGCFVNTLALRVNTDFNDLKSYLLHVREVNLQAQSNQDVPFERVIEKLGLSGSEIGNPLSQVAFAMNTTEKQTLHISGLTFAPIESALGHAKSDLRVHCAHGEQALTFDFVYDSSIFSKFKVEKIRDYLFSVLANMADAATCADVTSKAEICRLPAAQQRELLNMNHGPAVARNTKTLQELIIEGAFTHKDNIAAVCPKHSLTFSQLATLSLRLAGFLKSETVPTDRVGILLPANCELIVSLLGVLASGVTYVPLLSGQGKERIEKIVDDAGINFVITNSDLVHEVPLKGVEVVMVDKALSDPQWLCEYDDLEVCSSVDMHDLAYIIYTSGSTGKPKGVEITHLGLLDYCQYAQNAYYQKLSGSVLVTQYAFDISIPSLFVPLLQGGTVNLCGVQPALQHLANAMNDECTEASLLRMTPMHVQAVLELLTEPLYEQAHCFVIGGEAFAPELAKKLQARFPNSVIYNHYGPSETVVGCAIFNVSQNLTMLQSATPIGQPMDNTALYVLDENMQLVPWGAPGELFIGGLGVARGYINLPALTEEKFIENPFSCDFASRLYASGDRVYLNPHGQLVFSGRRDEQVKLRGFRVELGEIAQVISSYPAIQSAVVAVQDNKAQLEQLVAYVVLEESVKEQTDDLAGKLKLYLTDLLPDYMIPSHFELLTSLPLNANGKINRKALPAISAAPKNVNNHVLPTSQLELFVANIWQDILNVDTVAVHDNFFDLGGHSLLAIRAINKVQQHIGEIIHLAVIFDHPSLAEFCQFLTTSYTEALIKTGLLSADEFAVEEVLQKLEIDDNELAQFKALIPKVPALQEAHNAKNPKAIFILSPPRSGSTLLRVMLAGHPQLFAPPELELLHFNSLEERKEAFSGRYKFRLEGTVRALMEAKHIDADTAEQLIAEYEASGMSVKDFYGLLQDAVSPAVVLDKTPYYSYHPDILRQAELNFDDALFIHLVRHPHGMISSFEKAQMDQVLYIDKHDYTQRQLGEMVWANSHTNILEFLSEIPQSRQHRLYFEDLLSQPEVEGRKLCEFLGVKYDPALLNPYDSDNKRMTDGVGDDSRMLGDVKFHTHAKIDSLVRDAWKSRVSRDFLSDYTWELAESFGFERMDANRKIQIMPIVARENKDIIPLSFAQQRLWIIDQMVDNKTQYNNLIALNVEGRFDLKACESALTRIVSRHEILRTNYVTDSGVPVQVVQDPTDVLITVSDLTKLTEDEQNKQITALIDEETQREFDLKSDLMLRVSYAQLSDERGVLMFNIHHIASDGWSMNLLTKEFITQYQSVIDGQPDPLLALEVQYSDYAYWQRNWLQGDVLQEQLAYWDRQLAGLPHEHGLRLDYPRPEVKAHEGEWFNVKLEPSQLGKLKELAARHDVTLFMLLHAAISLVLSRHSNSDDIVIGTPMANRRQIELEPLIGFFINTLVLRANTDHEYFVELLRHVRQVSIDAQDNQDVPFDNLVERLNLPRDTSVSPAFQIIFNMGTNEKTTLALPGVNVSAVSGTTSFVKFDLHIIATEIEDHLSITFGFDKSIFKRNTIESISTHLSNLLAEIVKKPEAKLCELNMYSDTEVAKLVLGNTEPCEEQSNLILLHQNFEKQAQCRPDSVAVRFGNTTLTFGELNYTSNRLASYLCEQVAEQNEPKIGILLEKSVESVIAILAALKAGITYVPMDVSNPTARIQAMITLADICCVLSTNNLINQYQLSEVVNCVGLDDSQVDYTLHQYSGDEVLRVGAHDAQQLAYIIFTSGSTGKPKGVLNTYGNMSYFARGFENQLSELGVNEQSAWLWNASHAFDASVKGIVALCAGRTLVVPTEEEMRSPSQLVEILGNNDIEVFNAQPILMGYVLSELEKQNCGVSLIVSGDKVERGLVNQMIKYCQSYGTRAVNAYGPTEATVNATYGQLDAGYPYSIGQPMAGCNAYILDKYQRPVPHGVTGELYLSGHGIAAGYMNDFEATAQSFMADPHVPGLRMFKTGDMCRFSEKGCIEFVGRVDSQVKLRGYRIELDEITRALTALPNVSQAHVLIKETNILAYVVADESAQEKQLQAALSQVLPQYMLPSTIMLLEVLPVNANGKIDVNALPQPREGWEPQVEAATNTQNSDIATRMMAIWCDTLSVEQVEAGDDFFKLGGNSLLSLKLMHAIDRQFGVTFEVRDLFSHLTLSSQIEFVEARHTVSPATEDVDTELVPTVQSDEPCLLSFAQQRLWFIDQMQQGSAEYNMQKVLKLDGEFNLSIAEQVVANIIERHPILKTNYRQEGEHSYQFINSDLQFAIQEYDLSALNDAEQAARTSYLINQDSQRVFDLKNELSIRALFIHTGTTEQPSGMLVLNVHHIAFDGWSMGIFIKEFVDEYSALFAGQTCAIEVPSVTYHDYAVWQRNMLQGDYLASLTDYWSKHLEGAPVLHGLTTCMPRPANKGYHGGMVTSDLPAQVMDSLDNLAMQYGMTRFTLLHALLSLTLSRFSNSHDIVIGTPVANRGNEKTAQIIGLFLNMLVLRVDTRYQNLSDYLQHVKQVNTQALAHQDMPFEFLVELLKVTRSTSHNPLFQIMFSFNDNEQAQLDLPHLKAELLDTHDYTAKYDLTISVQQHEQGLNISWCYDSALFELDYIEGLKAYFESLLTQLAMQPQLNLLSDLTPVIDQAQSLLCDCQGSSNTYATLHTLFEAQSHKTPQDTALIFGNEQVSYEMLNSRANQLANYLISQGITAQMPVGVWLERSVDMVVALLAVLKAGGCYVPLDPGIPQARLAHILEETNIVLILTDGQKSIPPCTKGTRAICLDDTDTLCEIQHFSTGSPCLEHDIANDHLAYILFTSGSTGVPKGVMVEHQAICNFLRGMLATVGNTENAISSMLAVTALTFDIAGLELFGPLISGGKVILASSNDLLEPQRVIGLLESHDIEYMQATPGMWQVMMDANWQGKAELIALCGGEALPLNLARALQTKTLRLINCYGPTEATIWSLVAEVTDEELRCGEITLKGPLENYGHYVVGPHDCLTPVGGVGELFISGPSLARGYVNRNELNAERFKLHTLPSGDKVRLYRTGDLVRVLESGSLAFMGRVDHQVKIRGYRIELSEIEAQLAQCDLVEGAQVLVHNTAAGDPQLVAFVLSNSAHDDLDAQIKAQLAMHLPGYMWPAQTIKVEQWPLTSSGKIDRKALASEISANVREYVAAQTEVQTEIIAIWSELLNIPANEISIDDNFFELGGHSMLLMRLVAMFREKFAVDFDMRTLFTHCTVAKHADLLSQSKATTSSDEYRGQCIVKLNSATEQAKPLFCLPPGSGNAMVYLSLAVGLEDTSPCYGLQPPQVYEDIEMSSVDEMACYYIKLIKGVQPKGPYRLLGYSQGAGLAYEIAVQLQAQGEHVTYLGLIDAAPFDSLTSSSDWAWYRPIKTAIEHYINLDFDFDWSELDNVGQEHGLDILEAALLDSDINLDGGSGQIIRPYLKYFISKRQLMEAHQHRHSELDLHLYKVSSPLKERDDNRLSEQLNWDRYCQGRILTQVFEGSHFSIMSNPHVLPLVNEIKQQLNKEISNEPAN